MIYPRTTTPYRSLNRHILTNLTDFKVGAHSPHPDSIIKTRFDNGTVMVADNKMASYSYPDNQIYMRKSSQTPNNERFVGLLYNNNQHWIETLPEHRLEEIPDFGSSEDIRYEIDLGEGALPDTVALFKMKKSIVEGYEGVDGIDPDIGAIKAHAVNEITQDVETSVTNLTFQWKDAYKNGNDQYGNKKTILCFLNSSDENKTNAISNNDLIQVRYHYNLSNDENYRLFHWPRNDNYSIIDQAMDNVFYTEGEGRYDYRGSYWDYYDPGKATNEEKRQSILEQTSFTVIDHGQLRLSNYDTTTLWKINDKVYVGRNGRLTNQDGEKGEQIPDAFVVKEPSIRLNRDNSPSLEIYF